MLELLENQSTTTVESSLHISDSFLMIVDRTTTLQLNVITHAKHTHGVGNTKWQLFKWAKIANVCSNTTYVVVVCLSLVKKKSACVVGQRSSSCYCLIQSYSKTFSSSPNSKRYMKMAQWAQCCHMKQA